MVLFSVGLVSQESESPEPVLTLTHVAVVKAVDHASCKGPYPRRLVSVHLRRHHFAAVFVTWKGGGKTNALRWAPFDALRMIEANPDQFAGFIRREELLMVTRRTERHKLAFMIDFKRDCTEADFACLSLPSILAFCLLFSMLRYAVLQKLSWQTAYIFNDYRV